ncbi:hypothetical protein PO883_22130 [Massilia sp. DJPM01]|uniref:hypothetical protein n=1 Tax=Massilia sp. DJPM01 TaxID=3024404 RepID=UPI00259D8B19|nr:hypothetical protein [Massilia sp. DJPM01]MDM5179894.1 hypothetical protein [Massilia sp. DJPM01]
MDTTTADLRSTLAARAVTRTVNVPMPTQVYFCPNQFQRVRKETVGQPGCRAWTSGCGLRDDVQRRLIVNATLAVQAIGQPQDQPSP